ncbi:MAG: site-2 protease family protein, partial [Planctomycetota bacterium]
MSERKGLLVKRYLAGIFWLVAFGALVYLIAGHMGVFGNILLAVVGFGSVVLVHEFGHFVVAKLSGVKVEAFSIFMPPTLIGVRRTEEGFRFRILPKFFPKENDESGDGLLSFTVGRRSKAGDTEYRISLIPFGGFVKMLGQEDVGAAERSDDPRSYVNKTAGVRIAIIAAGVLFNIVSAVMAFIVVFLIGINLTPPVIGSVWPDSPAAQAGLRPGDEVIEIAGETDNLDFTNILVAAALSGNDEAVKLRVRHESGSEGGYEIVAAQ